MNFGNFGRTLVIGASPNIPLTWMTNGRVCRSDFVEFAALLGYPFTSVDVPNGTRMHAENGYYNKEELSPLYLNATFVRGGSQGLSGLYNTLLRIFRNNIAPEKGNLDAIRGGLINLLVYTHRLKEAKDEGEDMDDYEPLDVMDFIFHEIKHCIGGRHIPVYAPYVMMLLIDKAGASPTVGCTSHKFSYIQNKLPSAQMYGNPSTSTRRTRSASAAEGQTSRAGSSRSYFPEASAGKPNPWQRLLMCMGFDQRKSQYDQYTDTFEMKTMLNELLPDDDKIQMPAAPLTFRQYNRQTHTDWGSTEAFLRTDFETDQRGAGASAPAGESSEDLSWAASE